MRIRFYLSVFYLMSFTVSAHYSSQVDLGGETGQHQTPFRRALETGDNEIAILLISNGCSLEKDNERCGWTHLQKVALQQEALRGRLREVLRKMADFLGVAETRGFEYLNHLFAPGSLFRFYQANLDCFLSSCSNLS